MKKKMIMLIILICSSPGYAFAAIVYDLAADWSDAINPNGVWSYNSAPGQLITNHVADWDPTGSGIFGSPQPAWAESSWPNENHVPMWFKRISDTSTLDVPIGYVGMHGTEAYDPGQWVGAAWTSPGEGTVDITGGVWQSIKTGTHFGRNSDWQISLNDVVITSGNVSYDDAYSSSSPFYFYLASAGPSALSDLLVQKGDIISLEFKSHTTFSTFVGTQFTIDYSEIPIPTCEGDFEPDGDVDGSDLAVFAADFGRTDCYTGDPCEGDFDTDNDVDGSDLAVFAADFGRTDCPLVQITTHPDGDGSPAWSPNNSKIAFNSDRSGTWSIWVMNTDGTDKIQLTDDLGVDVQSHWRTDGAKLVFHSNRSGNWNIWMMDSDGSNLVQLTDDPANDYNPDFSPDGSAIIFQSDRSGNKDIWIMDSDGANPAQITDAQENEAHPHFSPDGSKIVYKSYFSGNYDIWTMDSDGSNAVQLTNSPENEGHPHFSPGGSEIVFWSERTGNREVWMMNTDGSEQTQLTNNPADDGGANWSPNSNKIVFRSDRAGNDDIWIYNLW